MGGKKNLKKKEFFSLILCCNMEIIEDVFEFIVCGSLPNYEANHIATETTQLLKQVFDVLIIIFHCFPLIQVIYSSL